MIYFVREVWLNVIEYASEIKMELVLA